MVTDKIQKLAKAKAEIAKLESDISSELKAALAALPAQYGFENAEDFTDAVKAAVGGKSSGKKRGPKPGKSAKPAKGKRGKRAKITDETRAEVKKMVQAEKTGVEIAKALGISLPSVQNIKKDLGLVKARK
ncbi:MAG: helix-turn-helix domain-containing protein [Nibricoccus sp.]